MIKKRLICMSCETRCDVIITHSNFEDDDIEIKYCPACSTDIEAELDYDEDYED